MINAHGRPLLPALTGLRFFAALAIFNVHFLPSLPIADGLIKFLFDAVKDAGVSGVSMFFALSGFILAYSNNEVATDRASLLKFWANRFSRIYPVYFLGILWFAPFILIHRYSIESFGEASLKALGSFIPTALMVQSWTHPRFAVSWNGPGWSLSVELVFYLLFPFLASRLRGVSPRILLKLCFISIVLSFAMSGVVPQLFPNWGYANEFVRFNPIFQLPTFIFGVSLGYYFLTDKAPKNGNILTTFSILAIFSLALLSSFIPKLVVHNSLFLPFFGTLFIGLARGGYGSKFLSQPIIVLLGESSYALYILQFSIDLTMLFIASGFLPQDYFDGRAAWGKLSFFHYTALLFISIAISVFIFKYFESPLRFRLRRIIFELFTKKPTI